MICSKMNNDSLTLNIGLSKKAMKNNIVWMFENIFANLT
jgi:hypothetical protein